MYLKQEKTYTKIIEKSRFICYLKHVKTEIEYKEYLQSIRKKHYDSSHVCSAFISDSIKRSSDDGEPSGTAGVPILNVLEKNNLNQMCALVVRYFGGIKLGTGGLARAYSSTVSECLIDAVLYEDVTYPKYSLTLSYELGNKVEYYLRNNTILLDTKYETDVTYIFALDDINKIDNIIELTKGIKPLQQENITIEKIV